MSALAKIWIVRDPGPYAELGDVVWEQDVRRLGDYVFGAGPGVWAHENHTIFTDRDEAMAEGARRLERVHGR